MFIKRTIKAQIEHWLEQGKIAILYGPRQVGKTTLAKEILKDRKGKYINCENLETRQALESQNAAQLRAYLGEGTFFVLDEAQRVENIGLALKLLKDTFPELQLLATGSSSFDLANKISEPLTGRSVEFHLYPFSYGEIAAMKEPWEMANVLDSMLRYGSYPELTQRGWHDAELFLQNISSNYLFRDVLEFEQVKKPKLLTNLLQLLALQVGNEVSLNELATKLETGRVTISRYLDLLEKSFVIFTLYPLSRNPRNEIGKKNKIYFYDLGMRNAIISRFNQLPVRDDIGALWENFCIVERMKSLGNSMMYRNHFFWRDRRSGEVDYVEEYDGAIHGYEFKWGEKHARPPKNFIETYQGSYITVNKENFSDFISG
ncbi:MAG: ATP-binding protein [Candidatus Paceibacterota bacterium]|jgi:hypothetical protein